MPTVALDCEMVASGNRALVAKVSVVDEYGRVLLDEYVKPNAVVTDYRTVFSGIEPHHLQYAKPFATIRNEVEKLLSGSILVGHSLHFDLQALELSHPERSTRDLAKYPPFIKNGQPQSLKTLAKLFLKKDIQRGTHNSLEDARAAMELYRIVANQW